MQKERYCIKCEKTEMFGKCECGDRLWNDEEVRQPAHRTNNLPIEEGVKRFAHAMKDGQKHPPINGHEPIEDAPLLD